MVRILLVSTSMSLGITSSTKPLSKQLLFSEKREVQWLTTWLAIRLGSVITLSSTLREDIFL
jgi:hypothetical protein